MSSNYNPDEVEVPEWLNQEFITKVMIQYENTPELKLKELKLTPGSTQGDHYASVIYRANIAFDTAKGAFSKTIVIKTVPDQDGRKTKLVNESQIFQTEIAMYTEVLPMLETRLREAGDDTKLFVPCIYHSLEPRKIIIFEDLVAQGYDVIRNRSLTVAELKIALEKLGKWHAVSHKLLKEQSEFFDKLQYNFSKLPNFENQSFLTNALPNFIYMLDEVENLKQYKKYFEKLRGNLIQLSADATNEYRNNPKENSYYVLCHGDFHIRNLMFNSEGVIPIDFQLSYVGPMVNDLQYAMYMLFDADQREKYRDELINCYLSSFESTLKRIGYQGKVPSFEEFQIELLDKKYYESLLLIAFLPMQIASRKNAIDPYRRRISMYKDEDYQKEVEYQLDRMDKMGYFRE